MGSKFVFISIVVLFWTYAPFGPPVTAFEAAWKPITSSSEAIFRRPDPAGMEDRQVLYLCRGEFVADGNHTKPGKLVARDGLIYCYVSHHKKEIKINDFEMLEAPAGSTSWVPFNGTLPTHAIYGGASSNTRKIYYICRGLYQENLIVGHIYVPENKCYITSDYHCNFITKSYNSWSRTYNYQ